MAASNKEIYNAINKNALSWNIIAHSLQCTFFITLGRLFDLDGEAFSIHAFLRACIDNIDQFSKEALRIRKIKDLNGKEPYWLNKYIEDAYAPAEKDLQILRGETSKKQKEYEDVYKPIRNQIIAHKDKQAIESVDELFGKTRIGQVEEILQFLHQIEMIVFELLANGHLSRIGDFSSNEEAYVQKDVASLLKSLQAQQINAPDAAEPRR